MTDRLTDGQTDNSYKNNIILVLLRDIMYPSLLINMDRDTIIQAWISQCHKNKSRHQNEITESMYNRGDTVAMGEMGKVYSIRHIK